MGPRLLCVCLLLAGALATPASAALVSITADVAVDSPDYDLTNVYGLNDWAYWAQTSSTLTAPVAPTNEKLGGSLISGISAFGGGSVRGTTSTSVPDYDFFFTNGTSTASGTVNNLSGLFNTQLGSSGLSSGVQLSVTAPSADPFNVFVWATVFGGTASITADIGATSVTGPSYTATGTRAPGRLFTINVTPDSAGQVLTLKYGLSAQTDGNANASLSAVAVTAVPEPSTLALLLGGSLVSLRFWQRRRAGTAALMAS